MYEYFSNSIHRDHSYINSVIKGLARKSIFTAFNCKNSHQLKKKRDLIKQEKFTTCTLKWDNMCQHSNVYDSMLQI